MFFSRSVVYLSIPSTVPFAQNRGGELDRNADYVHQIDPYNLPNDYLCVAICRHRIRDYFSEVPYADFESGVS